MNENKYLNDLKNLQPLPPEKIQRPAHKIQIREDPPHPCDPCSVDILQTIPKSLKEVKMEKLNNSKTLWGFGIAVFIYIIQNILVALNITSPDNMIVKAIIEAVIAIAGFFGVYGVRDALRKMSL